MKITAIIPAAGTGSRYDDRKNKLLEELQGIPVIIRTLNIIAGVDEINEIIICTSPELTESISRLVNINGLDNITKIILGGSARQESVCNGLEEAALKEKPDYVLIHDGARPLISRQIIRDCIDTARFKGAAITAVPTKDTIKRVDLSTGEIIETLDREELWNIQTPQVFKFDDIIRAHQEYKGQNFTDDAALLEKAGVKVFVSRGSYKNIKITTPEDLLIAENFILK